MGTGPAFAHGTTGAKQKVAPPPYIKICKKKKKKRPRFEKL
jgi:hypothetical protein